AGASAPRVTESGRPYHGKGALHAKVSAWLAANPEQEVTAGQVGRAIDGSPGAVTLIFDKLVQAGAAQLVCDKPKKVRWAGPAAPSTAAPTPAKGARGKTRAGKPARKNS